MIATNNPNLTCTQVDDATSNHSGWSSPATGSYSENCNYMAATDAQKSAVKLYPNSTSSELYFSKECTSIKVYSTDGKLLQKNKEASKINISNRPSGIYQIQGIDSSGNRFSEKVLKK